MKNLIHVKHCKNVGALKRLLNLLASDEHVTHTEWQTGLSGYTVVYHVDEPGYNVRGGKHWKTLDIGSAAKPVATIGDVLEANANARECGPPRV